MVIIIIIGYPNLCRYFLESNAKAKSELSEIELPASVCGSGDSTGRFKRDQQQQHHQQWPRLVIATMAAAALPLTRS